MIGRILICTTATWGRLVRLELIESGVGSVVISEDRGTQLLEFIRSYRPDIFIADAMYLDNSLEPMIRVARKEFPDMRLAVFSAWDNRAQKLELEKAGVDHQFLLPVDYRLACNRILNIEPGMERYAKPEIEYNKVRLQAMAWIGALQIPANCKGYPPLCDAVAEGAKNWSMIKQIMDTYGWLAVRYQTSSKSIERNIRTAIQNGWAKGGHEAFLNQFGYPLTIEEKNGAPKPPSNALLIKTLAGFLRLNLAQEKQTG